jgi:hypothetical protein
VRAAICSLIASAPETHFTVKDAFQCLDLASLGFRVLFDASWIYWAPARTLRRQFRLMGSPDVDLGCAFRPDASRDPRDCVAPGTRFPWEDAQGLIPPPLQP